MIKTQIIKKIFFEKLETEKIHVRDIILLSG